MADINGKYIVETKSNTGIKFSELGWVMLTKDLQESTLPHIKDGDVCMIEGSKSEAYKYPLITSLVPINEEQSFVNPKNDTQEAKPNQAYWDAKQDLITKEWAYGQAKDLVLAISKKNNVVVYPDKELEKDIRNWAGWFYGEVKGTNDITK